MADTYRGPNFVVVGWDGGCLPYLEGPLSRGRLPNLGQVLARGAFGVLQSTIPPITPVAWSTILTGCNPGSHGIFGWWHPVGDAYALEPYDSRSLRVPHLFRLLGEGGVRLGGIGVPLCKPAFPVNGFVLGGISRPNSVESWKLDSIQPAELAALYAGRHPELFHFSAKSFENATSNFELLQIWRSFEELRMLLIEDLVRRERPALLWVHCHMGDYFGHREPAGSPVLEAAFEVIDRMIGGLLQIADPEATLMVLSDHGQSEIHNFVLIQNWLEQAGLLRFHRRLPEQRFGSALLKLLAKGSIAAETEDVRETVLRFWNLYSDLPLRVQQDVAAFIDRAVPGAVKDHSNIDWARTQAYSSESHGLIRINLQGRDPQGIVRPAEYDSLVDRICKGLDRIENPVTGERMGIRAWPRANLYSGAAAEHAADIICEVADSTCHITWIHALHLGVSQCVSPIDHAALARNFQFLDQEYRGDHSSEGFFAAAGPSVRSHGQVAALRAMDIAPTLLSHLGLAIPNHIEGAACLELLHSLK